MKPFRTLLTRGLCLALYLSTYAAWGAGQVAGGPVDLISEPLLTQGAVAYQGTDGLYALYPGRTEPTPILTGSKGTGKILAPRFAKVGERFRAAWIEKAHQGNRLFALTAGADGSFPSEPKPLLEGSPSNHLELWALDDQSLVIPHGTIGKSPSLALEYSTDGGAHFQHSNLPLGDITQLHGFAAIPNGKQLHLFVHALGDANHFIGLINFDAETGSVSALEPILNTPITPFMVPFLVNGRPGVLYKSYENEKFSLRLAVWEPSGWQLAQVGPADGLDVARVDAVSWPDGRILLVYSGERRSLTKQRVFVAISSDGGQSWAGRQLDSAELANTRAWLPQVAAVGDRVVVAWEDARDIRSRIRVQLSSDRGATWLAQDLPLSQADRYAMRPRIEANTDQIAISWQQFRTDAKAEAETVLRTLTWNEVAALADPPEIQPDRKQAMLRENVDAYWQAMEQDNLETAYGSQDPFYRAGVNFARYAGQRGTIRYHKHEIKDLILRGNEAAVAVQVNFSVPTLKALGSEQSIPPTDHLVQDTWLFLDGRWYRKHVDGLTGGSAIQY